MVREPAERTTDVLDLAAELQDNFNNRGIAAAAAATAPQTDPDYDGKHCIECFALIPKARRDLGRIKCVGCQEALEKKEKAWR